MTKDTAARALGAWRRAIRKVARATKARQIAERIDGWRLERAKQREREAAKAEAEAHEQFRDAQADAYKRVRDPRADREDDPSS